jgi:hypothetical protein
LPSDEDWAWVRDEAIDALIAADLIDKQTEQNAQAVLNKLRADQLAKERFRAEKIARLDSGELTEAGKRFREKISASRITDLRSMPDPVPVIDGLLYRETVNYLVGASGAYKSVAALDMAARIGAGMDFCGMRTSPGRVLYIIAEGAAGMKYRQQAWEEFHKREMQGVEFIPFAVQIPDTDEMSALIQEAIAGHYVMVVFDTQAMCTIGIDENSNEEMAMVISSVQRLANATKACVVLVHHMGKTASSGIRGASGQYANVNTVIAVDREGSGTTVTLSTARGRGGKQKDTEEIPEIQFVAQQVARHVVLTGGVIPGRIVKEAPMIRNDRDLHVMNIINDLKGVGITQSQLAAEMDVHATVAGRALGRLKDDDLIDNHGARWHITQRGEAALQNLDPRT